MELNIENVARKGVQIMKWSKVPIDNYVDEASISMTNAENEMRLGRYLGNSTPPRDNRKFFLVALGVILFIVVVSIVAYTCGKTSDLSDELSLPSNSLIISSDKTISYFDLTTKQFHHLRGCTNKIRTFALYKTESLLWSEEENSTVIRSSSKVYPDILHTKRWKPLQALAIDDITRNVYIVHKSTGTVNVIDETGKKFNVVLSDLKDPHDIVLDVEKGLMFIAEYSKSIIRAHMDGTNLSRIITDTRISAITLDSNSSRIYWTSDNTGIKSSTYEGKDERLLVPYTVKFQGLNFLNNTLFWLLPKISSHHNASLTSCQIKNNECDGHITYVVPFENPRTIKSYRSSDRKNSCENSNCTDLCLLTTNGSYTCACKVGFQLNKDMYSCRIVTEYALIIVGNIVKGQIIDAEDAFTDAILPIELAIAPMEYKLTVDFDLHLENNDLFIATDKSILRVNLLNDDEQFTIVNVNSSDYSITDIAVDWVSRNLYYVNRSESSSTSHSIMVMNLRNYTYYKTIRSFPYTTKTFEGCPYSLIVHPTLGKLYFTLSDNESDISYIDIDNPEKLNTGLELNYFNAREILALDYTRDELYFPKDMGSDTIYNAHLDLKSKSTIKLGTHVENIRSMHIYGDDMYIGNYTSIYKFSLKQMSVPIRIFPKYDSYSKVNISGVKIFGSKIQSLDGGNEEICNVGDCDQICFAKPRKMCSCVDGQRLKNGKHCT